MNHAAPSGAPGHASETSAPRAEGRSTRRAALSVIAAAVAAWLAAVGAVALLSPPALPAAAAVAAALTALGCAVALVAQRRAARRSRALRAERVRAERLEAELTALRGEIDRAVHHALPWAVQGDHGRASADTVLAQGEEHLPAHPAVRQLVESAVRSVYAERRRLASALSVLESGASRVQAAVTAQVAELDRRKLPYWQDNVHANVPHSRVREDMEALDRLLAPMDLLAQRLLVLTGARRTGRPWPRPVPIANVVRAAVGRSEDFTRVVAALPPVPQGVRGPAVNAAIHVLSELIDNALQFSPPTTQVHVTVESATSGIVLHIDDSGLPMRTETLQRARLTVDLERPLDITDLSGSRLGLAAARLAGERFGMRIEFRPSITGGTRASVFLPVQWLSPVTDSPAVRAPAATERPRRAGGAVSTTTGPVGATAAATRAPVAAAPADPERTGAAAEPVGAAAQAPDGDRDPQAPSATASAGPEGEPREERRLPKRRRGSTLPDRPAARKPDTGTRLAPDEAARRMSSFHNAVRPSTPAVPPAPSDLPETP
ncbi:sensor histidine kinase [Streptomyces bohaiensis]|uniref:sensor histidine kinase n=1 Tax=Streptomyces bohaiensis TaxID=1431344 RepID=UPI003B7671F0